MCFGVCQRGPHVAAMPPHMSLRRYVVVLAAAVVVYGPPGVALTIATGWPTSRVVHWITTSLRVHTVHWGYMLRVNELGLGLGV